MKKYLFTAGLAIVLSGCASAPTGPDFSRTALPAPDNDKAQVIVFREYAEPTALAAKIDIDGNQVFELPQKSFATASVATGSHDLRIRWPAASGTPGWQGNSEWVGGKTYYYQLSGTSGNGWHFESRLTLLEESLAVAKLTSCCKLITSQKGTVTTTDAPRSTPQAEARHSLSSEVKAKFFNAIAAGMSPDEVTKLIGAPDNVSSKSTGKKGMLFYFGSDTRRESWSYSGIGFVVFTRNEYTASLKVVETKYDASAP